MPVDVLTVVLITATIFVWGIVSARLERADLTAPIVFMAVGVLAAWLGLAQTPSAPEGLKPLAEVTLVWVLFSDAARVRVRDLRHDLGAYVRLLAISLPLTVLFGWGLANWLFDDFGIWLALLVAAALAPTDAALGVPVVTNPRVPARVRRLITVESGLNDGIITPVVMVALAGTATAEGLDAPGPAEAVLELAVGAAVGVVIGFGGGWLLNKARGRGWAADEFAGIAVLALALLSYAGALSVHGNGFVAAFCAGLAFGAAAGPRGPSELAFLEHVSGLASLLVWLAFGGVAIPLVLGRFEVSTVLYAVLSLTVVRMASVALSLVGSGLRKRTVLFVGWFGPRGLASLVFALLALEELGSRVEEAVAVIAVTVVLSVIAHGASAAPLSARYARSVVAHGPEHGGAVPEMPVRGLPRRRGPGRPAK